MVKKVLVVDSLNMHYETLDGPVSAVKDVSFSLKEGESFGLVGESGCGKTSVAMSLLQLQADNAKITPYSFGGLHCAPDPPPRRSRRSKN